ncbi:hypothetical protein HDA35_002493 [Micromonospora purpureochromogenes]|uniref:Uncharacterized protein n=1 Tax=Micromonospora purpureochromogenes TaxID=47872 RepID=A0ABX2RJG8_9ACTN|nr:hypothetical protein [Micromonospora purpureochromogenes]
MIGRISSATATAVNPPTRAFAVRGTARSGPSGDTVPNSTAVLPACTITAPLPRNTTATEIASATTKPVCTGPAPITSMIRSPASTPRITPASSSTVRRTRLPIAAAIVPTAAAGANSGCGLCSRLLAMDQDSPAASPAWRAMMK